MGECLSTWGAKVRNLQQMPLLVQFVVLSGDSTGVGVKGTEPNKKEGISILRCLLSLCLELDVERGARRLTM